MSRFGGRAVFPQAGKAHGKIFCGQVEKMLDLLREQAYISFL